mmetsp:Transcript_48110/g.80920  ORF Transcript_48110/g.80920 Transcript_48110/m.80920 type:complete len:142 (-) Transcript_48110:819-1244(-)
MMILLLLSLLLQFAETLVVVSGPQTRRGRPTQCASRVLIPPPRLTQCLAPAPKVRTPECDIVTGHDSLVDAGKEREDGAAGERTRGHRIAPALPQTLSWMLEGQPASFPNVTTRLQRHCTTGTTFVAHAHAIPVRIFLFQG